VAVGLAVAALWMGPYVGGLLPTPSVDGFDRGVFGNGREGAALAVRFLGFAVVTPVVEELFVRSFLLRFSELLRVRGLRLEIDGSRRFEDLPVARYGARSFWVTMVWFTLSHAVWEWPVAFATCAVYNGWLYRRGHLGAVVRAHAVTNAAIFGAVLAAEARGTDWSWFL
jgi:CAAX prenyl protease-like protein